MHRHRRILIKNGRIIKRDAYVERPGMWLTWLLAFGVAAGGAAAWWLNRDRAASAGSAPATFTVSALESTPSQPPLSDDAQIAEASALSTGRLTEFTRPRDAKTATAQIHERVNPAPPPDAPAATQVTQMRAEEPTAPPQVAETSEPPAAAAQAPVANPIDNGGGASASDPIASAVSGSLPVTPELLGSQPASAGNAGVGKPNNKKPRTVTVQPGDTLWKIARRVYGDPQKFQKLIDANPQVTANRRQLTVGEELVVPDDAP